MSAPVPTGGLTPRFFALGSDAKHLYVANQDSHEITVFHIDDGSRATLIPTGVRIGVGSPSAIGRRNALLKDQGSATLILNATKK